MAKIELYHDLIYAWSKKINIISRNDLNIILERHILDSLVPIDEIPETGIMVDVGSGAGFPAVPIALIKPQLQIIMIESRQKKVVFLNDVIASLKLENTAVWNGRIEDFEPRNGCDIITIRAVAITEKLILHLKKIVQNNGKIIYYNKFSEYEIL